MNNKKKAQSLEFRWHKAIEPPEKDLISQA
jgi:hypothetical protein